MGVLPFGFGAQQGQGVLPLGRPAIGGPGGGAQLLVGEQGGASSEVITAQGDGVRETAGLLVAVGEMVDQGGVDRGEFLGLTNAALGPFKASAGRPAMSSSRAMSRWVAVRREVGSVHGDRCVDVPPRLRQALHHMLLGPAVRWAFHASTAYRRRAATPRAPSRSS